MRVAWPKQPVARRPRPTELGWPGARRSRAWPRQPGEGEGRGLAEATMGHDICPQLSSSRNRSIEALTMGMEG